MATCTITIFEIFTELNVVSYASLMIIRLKQMKIWSGEVVSRRLDAFGNN